MVYKFCNCFCMCLFTSVTTNIHRTVCLFLVPYNQLVRNFMGLTLTNLVLHFFIAFINIHADTTIAQFFRHFPSIVSMCFIRNRNDCHLMRSKPSWESTFVGFNQVSNKALHSRHDTTVNHDWTMFFTVCSDIMKVETFW